MPEGLDLIPNSAKTRNMPVLPALSRWMEAGRSVQSHPSLHSEFKSSVGYVRTHLRERGGGRDGEGGEREREIERKEESKQKQQSNWELWELDYCFIARNFHNSRL